MSSQEKQEPELLDILSLQQLAKSQFTRRRLIVFAKQTQEEGTLEERGQLIPYKPGDWLVRDRKDNDHKMHIIPDHEFRVSHDPVGGKWSTASFSWASYRKKALTVTAFQVPENGFFIKEFGKDIPLKKHDWIVEMANYPPSFRPDHGFRRVYRPLDKNALEIWNKNIGL